jgi:hypothetical protein
LNNGSGKDAPMSNTDNHNRIVAFRAPPVLTSAMEAAAAEDMCSVSDIARGALARDLRRRGLLADLVDETERPANG